VLTRESISFDSSEYDKIGGEETILFHGTLKENLESILKNGLDSKYCVDPSIGVGVHMSSCLRMSYGFAGSDGPVFMCKVKLGDCEVFTAPKRDQGYAPNGKHSNHFYDEYAIYNGKRILPIAILWCGETR
jgi:hypothetical protein